MSDFLDREMSLLISDGDFKIDEEIELFKRVFDFLAEQMGQDTFKKYNLEKGCFEGAFSNASYEAILVGVGLLLGRITEICGRRVLSAEQDNRARCI